MKKVYVLDTNILLSTEGKAINGFADNTVIIPSMVLEELDNQKILQGEKGFSARECIRRIYEIQEKCENLSPGVELDNGGFFKIETNSDMSYLPNGWKMDKPDNIILGAVNHIRKHSSNAILITNDVSMRIKASIIGMKVQGYKNDQIEDGNKYTGVESLFIPADKMTELYDKKQLNVNDSDCDIISEYNSDFSGFIENCFYIIKNEENPLNTALGYFFNYKLRLINKTDFKNISGINPKNAEQTFALDALMSKTENIPLVILKGCAGSGKTMLALAAGLKQMEKGNFDKIIITRSNTLADEDMGFLPGTLEEKMSPLLAPFYDNLRFLLKMSGESDEQIAFLLDDMISRNSIEIVSLAYIRGRSIPNAYIIIDEAQNLTITQAKTIVTRAGISSKIVFLGDTSQIDNPKLDKRNNGISFLSEKFKGNSLCKQLEFTESVRSELSKEAIKVLG